MQTFYGYVHDIQKTTFYSLLMSKGAKLPNYEITLFISELDKTEQSYLKHGSYFTLKVTRGKNKVTFNKKVWTKAMIDRANIKAKEWQDNIVWV